MRTSGVQEMLTNVCDSAWPVLPTRTGSVMPSLMDRHNVEPTLLIFMHVLLCHKDANVYCWYIRNCVIHIPFFFVEGHNFTKLSENKLAITV
jgi:hypothetical protein